MQEDRPACQVLPLEAPEELQRQVGHVLRPVEDEPGGQVVCQGVAAGAVVQLGVLAQVLRVCAGPPEDQRQWLLGLGVEHVAEAGVLHLIVFKLREEKQRFLDVTSTRV